MMIAVGRGFVHSIVGEMVVFALVFEIVLVEFKSNGSCIPPRADSGGSEGFWGMASGGWGAGAL